MAHSSLATISVPANGNNYTVGRPGGRITKITVHHMAGVLSAQTCGGIFQNPNRGASSHYGIGYNGEIAWYVDENNTAWTDSNWDSNIHSVTIENSDCENGGDWRISDATMNSLIKLVADIAKRNGLGKLVPGQNLTWHSMYAATTCPGNYLRSKMQYIADSANKINYPSPEPTPTPTPTPTTGFNVGDKVTLKNWVDYYGTPLMKTRDYYFISEINGDRAVLNADSVNGVVYAAVNTNNLEKAGGGEPAPAPAPAPSTGFSVGDKVTLSNYVDYYGTPLMKTRDYYFISEINGNRAVLNADSVNGTVYAAVNTDNLVKVGAAQPSQNIQVGDKVTLKNWVDIYGTHLLKTRDYYYVSQLIGDYAVLRADNAQTGTIYAAVYLTNLVKV